MKSTDKENVRMNLWCSIYIESFRKFDKNSSKELHSENAINAIHKFDKIKFENSVTLKIGKNEIKNPGF